MATQVQFRRGTTSQNNAFTGAIGELTYDTEVKTLRLHDGSSAGGGAIVATLTASQTLTNKVLSTSSVWNGTAVGLAYGGTNANITAAAGAVVYSTSSALGVSLAGTSGQVLTSGGTSAPTWVSQSSLTVGNATTAATATNISGGSAGYIMYQVDTNETGFIPPGTSGQVLRSTGASTAADWVNGNVILGSTTLTLGSTTTTVAGLNILASTGTSHWTLPAGTTSQRPESAAAGMVRYNSEISSFEGYGPGGAWGSLGGVKDVDGDTYLLTEASAGSDEDTFTFYNAGSSTLTLSGTKLDVKSAVQVEINNTTDSSSITTGALVVDGGVGIAKKLYVGTDASVAGTLAVTGATTLTGALAANGGITVDTNAFTVADTTGNTAIAGTLTVTGATVLNGGLTMDTNKFTVADTTGNTAIGGTLAVTGATTMSAALAMSNNKITGLATPTASTDAANKDYVDGVAQGILAKPSVEIATTANLTATYDNGTSGVGATLTATSNGAFPAIDGITLSSTTIGENGVLVKNQSTAAQNGRYNLTQVGDAGTPWILTRCGLCDEADEIPGAYVFVKRGTLYAGTGWVQTVADPATFTVGTDAITVTQFSGAGTYTAGTGLTLTGTQFSVNASQTQITAVGTLTSGTWNATLISPTYGGTGVNNGTKTITLGGNLTTSGAHATTITTTGTTGVTLPTSGTLVGSADTGTVTNTMLAGSIANAKLANSSVTVGTTAISLGASATTIAGLSSVTSTSFVGALTGNASTATTLATGRTIAITGDLTYTSPSFNGSGNVTAAGTLATVNSNVGQFGSGSAIPVITVNAKGLVTAVSTSSVSTTISLAGTSGSGSVAGGGTLTFASGNGVTSTVSSSTVTVNTPQDVRTSAAPTFAGVTSTAGFTATSANPFVYTATTISANVTIPSNYNAMAAGPITINDGVTVTVPDGSTLTIV